MKVVSGASAGTPATPVETVPAGIPAAPRAAGTAATAAAPGSALLQPAIEAARQAPGVDPARVAALRDQLAQGKLPFDAAKLADLIERYHRGN